MLSVFRTAVLCALLAVELAAQDAPATNSPSSTITWAPYDASGADGKPVVAELGRLRVPERRANADGPTIELAFVRFKSSNPAPASPVVYLVGGPGPSGIEYGQRFATGRLLRMLDTCDVIALDQRGTGLSRPNLSDAGPFSYELPLDQAVTREQFVAAYRGAVAKCAEHWRAKGVDLRAYNTLESAEDIESLRVALGLEQIRLWGESYGTHLGLAYLRAHSEHVESAVLSRVEGPDDTLKLPSTTQRHLEQLHALVAADPEASKRIPDLIGSVRVLLERLAQAPIAIEAELNGKPVEVTIGPFDLQTYLANSLGLAFELRDTPDAVARMNKGDWSPLAPTAIGLRRGEIGSAMALMMDCSSGGSPQRLRRIAKERAEARNLLGDAVNVPYPDACAGCGSPDLGELFRTPFACSTRVLFVSGSLDARTPPENVEALLAGFPRATHIVAQNAGHEPLEMLSADFRTALAGFLGGEKIEQGVIVLPQVRFRWTDEN